MKNPSHFVKDECPRIIAWNMISRDAAFEEDVRKERKASQSTRLEGQKVFKNEYFLWCYEHMMKTTKTMCRKYHSGLRKTHNNNKAVLSGLGFP